MGVDVADRDRDPGRQSGPRGGLFGQPAGPVAELADRLVEVDLLDRAAELLESQVRYRLAGPLKARVGARLAVIRLLDRAPDQAMKALADEIDEQSELIGKQQEFIEEIADWTEQLEADLAELEEGPWYTEGDEEPGDEEEGEGFGSATCPECGHLFFFDPDAYEDGDAVECPGCGFCMIWPHDVAEIP